MLTQQLSRYLQDAAARQLESDPDIEGKLGKWLQGAEDAWHEVAIPRDEFLGYIAKRVLTADDICAALAGINWSEVYLACACGQGQPAALAAFEHHYLSIVPGAIAHLKLGAADVEEVMQGIREKLLVSRNGNTRIDEYAGGGSMHGLVKVMAVRSAISLTRKSNREHPDAEDQLLRMPSLDKDPELESVKQEIRVHFKEAFEQAAEELEPRERNLLRMHLLDGVTLEQLATNYSVHRATVTRWLTGARQSLLKNTRKHLQAKVPGSAEELDAFAGLVESRIDLSYSRLLKTKP